MHFKIKGVSRPDDDKNMNTHMLETKILKDQVEQKMKINNFIYNEFMF